jgi:hypothetical protein
MHKKSNTIIRMIYDSNLDSLLEEIEVEMKGQRRLSM